MRSHMEGNYRKQKKSFKTLIFMLLGPFYLCDCYLHLKVQNFIPLWICIFLNDLCAQLVRQNNTHEHFFSL